jgi:hypothetical protein
LELLRRATLKQRTTILLIVVLVLVPLINASIVSWFMADVRYSGILPVWLTGFFLLIIEIVILFLPSLVPILGEMYWAKLGRWLGFPDERLEQDLQRLFNSSGSGDHRGTGIKSPEKSGSSQLLP